MIWRTSTLPTVISEGTSHQFYACNTDKAGSHSTSWVLVYKIGNTEQRIAIGWRANWNLSQYDVALKFVTGQINIKSVFGTEYTITTSAWKNKFCDVVSDFNASAHVNVQTIPTYTYTLCALNIIYSQSFIPKTKIMDSKIVQKDPDNVTFQKMDKVKLEAVEFFQCQKFQEAIEKFSECMEFDPLNNLFNSTILFNRALAYLKMGKTTNAMGDLNKAIKLNEDYVNAYLKRAELQIAAKEYEGAIKDFERVKILDQESNGIGQKIQNARLELKKSKRRNYYKLLGVAQKASQEDIKKAYKKQALMWHPDKHSNDDEEGKKHADVMFKYINEAYRVLQDPIKRSKYDQGADLEELSEGDGGSQHMEPSEIQKIQFHLDL